MLATRIVARRKGGVWLASDAAIELAAGERVEMVLSLPEGTRPVLLRARDGGAPVVLRPRRDRPVTRRPARAGS